MEEWDGDVLNERLVVLLARCFWCFGWLASQTVGGIFEGFLLRDFSGELRKKRFMVRCIKLEFLRHDWNMTPRNPPPSVFAAQHPHHISDPVEQTPKNGNLITDRVNSRAHARKLQSRRNHLPRDSRRDQNAMASWIHCIRRATGAFPDSRSKSISQETQYK